MEIRDDSIDICHIIGNTAAFRNEGGFTFICKVGLAGISLIPVYNSEMLLPFRLKNMAESGYRTARTAVQEEKQRITLIGASDLDILFDSIDLRIVIKRDSLLGVAINKWIIFLHILTPP